MTTADAGSGVIRLPLDGPPLAVGQDALDAIGTAWGSDVRETKAGDQVWFVADEAELATRLGVAVAETRA